MQLSMATRQRIVNLSTIKNLSLRKLSNRAGIPYSTLVSFMLGRTKSMTLDTLYLVCMGLDIDLVDFFDDRLFSDIFDEHEKKLI